MKTIDVYLDSGVSVQVPDDTDIDTDEGYLVAKRASKEKFRAMLTGDGFDVALEVYDEQGN
jgi:hypothetical protein